MAVVQHFYHEGLHQVQSCACIHDEHVRATSNQNNYCTCLLHDYSISLLMSVLISTLSSVSSLLNSSIYIASA